MRNRFRNEVFERDGHTCAFCDNTENLDAHHITDRSEMPNGGYVKENGITLCPTHHLLAEQFHISGGESWEESMHPNDLYHKIGTTKEVAVRQSEKLNQFT
ncbi:HNH endonuclease signature motif containing protein [uncultured Microscilla sp.]|uniref:HNH endonuclease n=1 Tax=uncultured Microscilla sp. TaxID=432653 RepID=UPI002630B0ED|nr:HNH endonuclease signature motif containing protein [uncultured Microscilla sp.]